jgi:ABC-type transporter Mla maintaining outer membrane lipid asymmetry ATPase subunit MlaF
MHADTPVLHCQALIKHYRGLRPLRIRELRVMPGERVVLSGLDTVAAEVLTNLINGATLPDEGEVRVGGRPTTDVVTEAEWLASLDRFGVVTSRAVLLDGMTTRQNLALPLTIEIDPVAPGMAARADALGEEAGIDPQWFERPLHEAGPPVRMRIHLARAIALDPELLLLEHPTVPLDAEDRPAFVRQVAQVTMARRLTVLACSQDRALAAAVATRYMQLQPATGELIPIEL